MNENAEEKTINKILDVFRETVKDFKQSYALKTLAVIQHLPIICRLHYQSLDNRKSRTEHPSRTLL